MKHMVHVWSASIENPVKFLYTKDKGIKISNNNNNNNKKTT